ncbi:MAG: MMPL family transporter [Burkholderiales bacterium]|nr:MMPL family transporter [Burkholderiales bacterium]
MSARVRSTRRTLVIALWLLALAAAALQVARSPFSADLSAFLPHSPDPRQRILIEQIDGGAPARTLLMAIGGGDAEARAGASRALAAALRADGRFAQVSNGEREAFGAIGDWLFEHRYQLSPAVTAEHFTAAGLREAFGDTMSLLGTPAGSAIKPLLDRDPSGEMQRIVESLIPVGSPRSEHGVWVSRSGDAALLLVLVRAAGKDLDAQQTAIHGVQQAFAATGAAARGLTLELSGAPLFAVQSRAQIEGGVRFLGIAGALLVSALLLAALASPLALVVAALPVATAVLVGIAAVGWAFGTVHGITLGFGATLVGESVDYAIYYLIQARGAAVTEAAASGWRGWLRESWPTVRLGLLTSVCGFAALVCSDFPGIAQLGVFSIAGLVAAALTTRFVLPVLQPDGAGGSGVRGFLGAFALAALRRLPRWRRPLVALGVAALALLALRGDLWQADLGALSPLPKAALELDQRLRADLTGGDERPLVVVPGADVESALERAEVVATRLDALVDQGTIGGYDSVTRVLPSLATQRARRAALPDAPTLRTAVVEATRGGPLAAARLEPFVRDVERAREKPPITPAAAQRSAVAPLVDALLTHHSDGSANALLPLANVPGRGTPIDAGALRQALAGVPGAQVIDLGSELHRLYGHYLRAAQWQALLGALAVVALMALALRSLPRLLAVCQPLLLAVLLTLGGMAATGTSVGILHLVGLLLVVAIGSNYALFFDLLQRDARGPAPDTLASLLLANLTTVASFGLLAISPIAALAAIGRVVAPGALLALVLSAAFAAGPRQRV